MIRSRAETPTVHDIRIAKPDDFTFRPVQFCGLELETDEGGIEYSMSLASSPTKDYLQFGARRSDSAWKRTFVNLRPGDEVEIDGPYGRFVLDEHRPAVLVAGGIGITPLKGMMEYATDRNLSIDVVLVYSIRTPTEIAYKDDLEALARENPKIRILYTITRSESGQAWNGRVGRIDADLLRSAASGLHEPTYYVCGKPGLVEGVFEHLRALRVPRGRVMAEEFWGY